MNNSINTSEPQARTPSPSPVEQGARAPSSRMGIGGGSGGSVPPPKDRQSLEMSSYKRIIKSMSDFFEKGDSNAELAAGILQLRKNLSEQGVREIKLTQQHKQTLLDQKKAKLEEAGRKLEEARGKEDNKIWKTVQTAFNIIGAVVAIAVGTAMIATGAGAIGGAVIIAMGVVQLYSAVDGIIEDETGKGTAGHIAVACGASDEVAAQVDFGVGIGLTAVGVIFGFVAIFIPGAQVSLSLKLVKLFALVMEAGFNIAGAVGQVYTGVENYQAADLRKKAAEISADTVENDARMMQLDEVINTLIDEMQRMQRQANKALDGSLQALNDTATTMARANFTA